MSQVLAERTARALGGRTSSRRTFLRRVAIVGAALATAPLDFILRPVTAYAAVCGPADQCNNGYTVFCCTVNRGQNRCPPGMFVGGWWKAADSNYCCDASGAPSDRYYIDCHPVCTCEDSGGGNFCSPDCIACACRCNSSAGTCDQRRVCCNRFRYGQCHTEIEQSGPVACRVVSCVPPYQLFDDCGSTVRVDNFTRNHTAPCLAGDCT
jgi:hypothetical protein